MPKKHSHVVHFDPREYQNCLQTLIHQCEKLPSEDKRQNIAKHQKPTSTPAITIFSKAATNASAPSYKFEQNKEINFNEKLKEIKRLLRLDEVPFQMRFDETFKLKFKNHIRFINILIAITDELLDEEAMLEFIGNSKRSEVDLNFSEQDKKRNRERHLDFEKMLMLAKQQRMFFLIAMLMNRIKMAKLLISQYKHERNELKNQFQGVKIKFKNDLHLLHEQSHLFDHLDNNQKNALDEAVEEALNNIDAKYAAMEIPAEAQVKTAAGQPQRQQLLYSGNQSLASNPKEIPNKEREQAKHTEKKNVLMELYDKFHNLGKKEEAKSSTLADTVKKEELAENAIKMHQAYVAETKEIEQKIKKIDEQIKREEDKMATCEHQLEGIIDPQKRETYHKTIERTFSQFGLRYTGQKKKLEEELEEKKSVDNALMMLRPDLFPPSSGATPSAVEHQDKPKEEKQAQMQEVTENAPGQRKFKAKAQLHRYQSKKDLKQGVDATEQEQTTANTQSPTKNVKKDI